MSRGWPSRGPPRGAPGGWRGAAPRQFTPAGGWADGGANSMRGRMMRAMASRGGGARWGTPTPQPSTPCSAPDPDFHINQVHKKRVAEEGEGEYYVTWEKSGKDDSWGGRELVFKYAHNRPLLKIFEDELLDKVKTFVKKCVEDEIKLALPDLQKLIAMEHPTFQMTVHRMRNLTALVRTHLRDVVKVENGFAVSKAEANRLKQEEELNKKAELFDAYLELHEAIRIQRRMTGDAIMGNIGSTFTSRTRFEYKKYGFRKFRDFVKSCPGIWVDPNAACTPYRVEIRDERPPELKAHIEKREKEGRYKIGDVKEVGHAAMDRQGLNFSARAGGFHDRDRGRKRSRSGGRRRRSRSRKSRSRSRGRRKEKRRSRSRSRKRKRSKSKSKSRKRKRSKSSSKSKSRSRSKSEKKKKKKSRSPSKDSSSDSSAKKKSKKKKKKPTKKTRLPSPWEEVTDPNTGSTYYWNQDSNETTWERPEAK